MKKILGTLTLALALFALAGEALAQGLQIIISRDITTASTYVGPEITTGRLPSESAKYFVAQAKFTHGAGGTAAKAYVQTTLDEGLTWADVMCFAFTTSSATKASAISSGVALAAATSTTDGALADNTILNGLIGNRFRVKLVTTGTYTSPVASAALVYADITDATDTKIVVIAGTSYTFVAVVANPYDVKIAGTADGTLLNLARCINKSGGTEGAGQDYIATAANVNVSASLNAGTDTLTLTAKAAGAAGNALTITSPVPNTEPTFTLPSVFSGGSDSPTHLTIGVVPR